MKVFKGVKKGIQKSLIALNKLYGVDVEIYKPVQSNNISDGYKTNSIRYEENPYFIGKALVPYLFKTKTHSLDFIDDLFDDSEIIMYIPLNDPLIRYSKVKTIQKKGIENFIIDEILEIKDDEQTLLYKYKLVPDTAIHSEDQDIVLNTIIKDNELEEKQPNESITKKEIQPNTTIKYNPVG